MTSPSPLKMMLTRAGMRAVFRADNEGLQARITHMAFGDKSYTPTGAETRLQRERVRVPVAGGSWVGDFMIHITALLDAGMPVFRIWEVGVFLEDGTLLAVWSDTDAPLAERSQYAPIAFAFDLELIQLPKDAITVKPGDLDLNLFFGEEFSKLAAGIAGNSLRYVLLKDRVVELEKLPARLETLIKRHEATEQEISHILQMLDPDTFLAAEVAKLAAGITGNGLRHVFLEERVKALERLPDKVKAIWMRLQHLEKI